VLVAGNLFSHCNNPFLKAETLTRQVAQQSSANNPARKYVWCGRRP